MATASVREGDMDETSSPIDILFWMIHPAIERLLAAKRIDGVINMGSSLFEKWPVVDGSAEEWLTYSYYSFEAGQIPSYPKGYICTVSGSI